MRSRSAFTEARAAQRFPPALVCWGDRHGSATATLPWSRAFESARTNTPKRASIALADARSGSPLLKYLPRLVILASRSRLSSCGVRRRRRRQTLAQRFSRCVTARPSVDASVSRPRTQAPLALWRGAAVGPTCVSSSGWMKTACASAWRNNASL